MKEYIFYNEEGMYCFSVEAVELKLIDNQYVLFNHSGQINAAINKSFSYIITNINYKSL